MNGDLDLLRARDGGPVRVPGNDGRSRARDGLRPGLLCLALLGCQAGGAGTGPPDPPPPEGDLVALTDLRTESYLGFAGGLYPGGANLPPVGHDAEGLQRARRIGPVDRDGRPDPSGAFVLLSVGMSNTTQEFCGGGAANSCKPWTFMGQAAADPSVRSQGLVLVDGARGGEPADAWDDPREANYDRIRDRVLTPKGLTEAQVQIVWVKQANARPTVSLPDPNADAYLLLERLADIVRALRVRYPNLHQVYVSSRIYAGYATTPLNPEPFAYESGFAVKWLIEAQIRQAESGAIDPRAGDLGYETTPWIGWGPYLWANGAAGRSDGLVWLPTDFQDDGTHPSPSGQEKVGRLLLEFFRSSPYASCWFLAGGDCG